MEVLNRRNLEEKIFLGLMLASVFIVMGSLILIVTVIVLMVLHRFLLKYLPRPLREVFILEQVVDF